jgi:hypothetical protein
MWPGQAPSASCPPASASALLTTSPAYGMPPYSVPPPPDLGLAYHNTMVLIQCRLGPYRPRRRMQHHSVGPTAFRLGHRLWCILSHHSHHRHALSLTPTFPHTPYLDRRWKQFYSFSHLSMCLGTPWTILPQRRSRSPSHHSQSPFCPSVHHRQFLFN